MGVTQLKIGKVDAVGAVIWPTPGWRGCRISQKLACEIGREVSNAAPGFFAESICNAPEHCREYLDKRANQSAVFFLLILINLSPEILS
jgi:hypothetical protein